VSRLIVQEFLSLDGLAAGPNGEVDFIPAAAQGDEGVAENQLRFIDTIDTIVLGRVTYELFAGYWPTASGDDRPFADKINATPKLVFSRTLERAPWGSWDDASISRDDPREEIPRLRERAEKDLLVWGSLTLVRALAAAGLVDEYQLWLLPVVLGGGRPLFAGSEPTTMRFLAAKTTDHGATLLRYEPRADGP
jgi:dihydrofolate reductase